MDKELIELYYNKKNKLDKLKSEVDTLNMAIKREMKNLNQTKIKIDDYSVRIQHQNKRTVKEGKLDKFISYLKEKGLDIIIKEDYDKNIFRKYVNNGKLDGDELKDYIDFNICELLYVNKNKGDK